MKKLSYFIKSVLDRPLWLLLICFSMICFYLILDGTLVRLLHLYKSREILKTQINDIKHKNSVVEERLKKLSDSQFLEQEVRDRFNLVEEEDIVFIFSEEKSEENN